MIWLIEILKIYLEDKVDKVLPDKAFSIAENKNYGY